MSPSKPKHGADCARCNPTLGGSRRPVGRVHQLPDGWAVTRWSEPEPIVSGLVDRRDGFVVLFALKHDWRTVSVRFRRNPDLRVSIELHAPSWEEGSAPDAIEQRPLREWLYSPHRGRSPER